MRRLIGGPQQEIYRNRSMIGTNRRANMAMAHGDFSRQNVVNGEATEQGGELVPGILNATPEAAITEITS